MYATNGALFPTWHLAWCHVLIFYGPSWVPYDSSPDLFVSLLPGLTLYPTSCLTLYLLWYHSGYLWGFPVHPSLGEYIYIYGYITHEK
jgi:hypothetical protein